MALASSRSASYFLPVLDMQPTNRSLQGLHSLIGNTPLLAIECLYRKQRRTVYAKAEHLNMTGSIKDRMAFHVLKKAYESGVLKPQDRIIEATSGNTGISFAAMGAALGHPVTIFMPDWMSAERKDLIRSLGAEIRLVSNAEGGFLGSIAKAEALAREDAHSFLPRQFSNHDNVQAHRLTTGPEIHWQLACHSIEPRAFVAGVGTGGTVMGVGSFLKEQYPRVHIHPLEPANSPTLSTGCKIGHHRIQGISDEFVPPIMDLNALDAVVSVDDGDAILMAQMLSRRLGLAVGISSGANFLGALKVQEQIGGNAVVVTVFSDDNKKYLSTDLMKEETVKPCFLSPEVELLGFKSIKRVCQTCCDPAECVETYGNTKQNPAPHESKPEAAAKPIVSRNCLRVR
jgi:cysteine synthase